jgi:hypothetical protein
MYVPFLRRLAWDAEMTFIVGGQTQSDYGGYQGGGVGGGATAGGGRNSGGSGDQSNTGCKSFVFLLCSILNLL